MIAVITAALVPTPPMKRKTRKMTPLTHFTEKAGEVYRSSLNISCLDEGSHTHFDLCEISGFLSRLLSGTEWHQWSFMAKITALVVLCVV